MRNRNVFIAAVLVLALAVLGIFVLHQPQKPVEEPEPTAEVDDQEYDASEGIINADEYDGTILAETEDAGREYIDSTLFLGDSNTARFLRFLSDDDKTAFTTIKNTIGVVGMGVDAIASLPCMQFSTGTFTIPRSVAILQPERVIIMFGTNNLYGSSKEAEGFAQRYTQQILAIQKAYPSVDIIVASIPPVSKVRDYTNVSMTQIDAYNKAIVRMCEENDWKYLNTAEALKDPRTGFAREGMMDKDGLHLSRQGLITLFSYIRTHAWITEDDRPKPLSAIPAVYGVVPDLIKVNPLNNEEFTEEPAPSETPEPQSYTVPNAKTLGDLRSWAKDKGIMISVSPSDAKDTAQIESLSPAAGAEIKEGQTIKVKVKVKAAFTVPQFATEAEAKAWETQTGIKVTIVYAESAQPAGTVLEQSVPAGQSVEEGSTVTVTVAKAQTAESPEPTDSPAPTGSPDPTTTPEPTTSPEPTETPAHTHSYASAVTQAATCGAPGVMTYTCSCGDSYTEAIPATGAHSWQENGRVDASCASPGSVTFICPVCGATYTETIPQLTEGCGTETPPAPTDTPPEEPPAEGTEG
ncbi:MAG: PASTA domain-containing protein [Solobacterium sp.]|nr:PASTA domain-containing protein [Solobacterium sp.]MBQ1446347.1 PASTA domain-containing protein [Solobacterium sp.]